MIFNVRKKLTISKKYSKEQFGKLEVSEIQSTQHGSIGKYDGRRLVTVAYRDPFGLGELKKLRIFQTLLFDLDPLGPRTKFSKFAHIFFL